MSDARAEGRKFFTDLQNSLKEAQDNFSELAEEQREQCQTIRDTAEKASRIAVEASEAFSSSKSRLMIWTALCAALLVSGGWLAGYWLGHSDGWASGDAHGYRQAVASNAAASWANTTSGKLAKKLDDEAILQPLATCNLSGFSVQKADNGVRWCVITGARGQFHGWAMP